MLGTYVRLGTLDANGWPCFQHQVAPDSYRVLVRPRVCIQNAAHRHLGAGSPCIQPTARVVTRARARIRIRPMPLCIMALQMMAYELLILLCTIEVT